jgi:hypothetical protein
MSALPIEQLVPDIRSWPDEDRVELAEYARVIEARRTGLYLTSESEKAAIAEAIRQADQGKFVDERAVRDLAKRIRP